MEAWHVMIYMSALAGVLRSRMHDRLAAHARHATATAEAAR